MFQAPTTAAPSQSAELLRSRSIEHVVVLGANGAMGLGSGALFTTAVKKVTFLARTKDKAQSGLDQAIRMVRSSTVGLRVEVGSYDDDFDRAVGEADLIFEAVTEILDLKKEFFARIDKARRDDSLVCTVTSGLSINELASACSDSFKENFCGLHFFNPPNVIVGTELVAGEKTNPAVLDFLEAYAKRALGRVIIRTKDRPGFAGNRVGFKVLNECAQLAEEHGPQLIDTIVGPYTGRALTPLRTVDLVGWDIHRAIVDNIHANAPDEVQDTLKLPTYMAELMEAGTLGNKSGRGFFMKDGKRRLALNAKTKAYTPIDELPVPDLAYIDDIAELHRIGRYEDAMAAFVAAPGDEAALARKVIAGYIAYSFARVGEVTDDILGIDLIMGYGFNWAPPSVLVDTIGHAATVSMIEKAGLAVPEALAKADPSKKLFNHPETNVGRFFVAG